MAGLREKVVPLRKLLTLRELWRWQGKTVVFTNGVFDLLHSGHVRLLEKARAQGDLLVVGLNSDASVRRLGKGPERPINRWADRAEVLAALSSVDAVVGFEEDTPARLLSQLKPDILVKGADYKAAEIAGREHAKRVVRVALRKGYSTTGTVARLRGSQRKAPSKTRT